MTDALPIGVFDSGIGGLTVLRALAERLPAESLIYLGDTARLPYGTKSADAIHHYALEAAGALVAQGIKALVVADNTSSAHALEALKLAFPDLPVIGVVEPGARAAAAASRSGHIAVMSTESTARAGTYPRAIAACRPDSRVVPLACPLFISMVEEGMVDGPIAEMVARHYLGDLILGAPENRSSSVSPRDRPDCLLLGCTHLPPLLPLFKRVLPAGTALVDSATTTAHTVAVLLADRSLACERPSAGRRIRYLVTDGPDRFSRVAPIFMPKRIHPDEIEVVHLG